MRKPLAAVAIRFAGVSSFVLALYLGVVAGGGWVAGFDRPLVGLMLLATAVVSVTIDPVSRWLTKYANRVVYGYRFTPQEALLRLSRAMSDRQESEEVLAAVAETIRVSTKTDKVVVWLRIEGNLIPVAAAPAGIPQEPSRQDGDDWRGMETLGLVVPIRQGTDTLGAITVAGDQPTTHEVRLIEDLAASASIVTQTAGLRESIRLRIDHTRSLQFELSAARAETASAQLAERRRLERNLHDTCQQRAVVLAGKLGLAHTFASTDGTRVNELVDEIESEITRLTKVIYGVAGGRVLPEMGDRGVGSALADETADLPVPVDVVDRLGPRFQVDLEEAVYACCMEAIQNAVKHAGASRIEVTLDEEEGQLLFRVCDDGIGFDAAAAGAGKGLINMRDRVTAFGGSLTASSSEGGTEIEGRVPLW